MIQRQERQIVQSLLNLRDVTSCRDSGVRCFAGLARRDERGIAALFARGGTQSEALARQNVYYT